MNFKTSIYAAVFSGAMAVAGLANAVPTTTVDFSPTATNNGNGAIGTAADFSAVGFQSNMASVLTISGVAGYVNYIETGDIFITSFRDAADNPVISGVGSDYTLTGQFTLSGKGNWSGGSFLADAATTVFGVDLYANGSTLIGHAALDPSSPQFALALVFGGLASGDNGLASTTLTAGLHFTPEPDYSGPDGFIQSPLFFGLAVGNAGGNTQNTGYSVAGTTVTVTLPTIGANRGTANATFYAVPEPGALALVGLGLVGLGLSRRRGAKAA